MAKNKYVASALLILLGYLGLGWFYVGKKKLGFVTIFLIIIVACFAVLEYQFFTAFFAIIYSALVLYSIVYAVYILFQNDKKSNIPNDLISFKADKEINTSLLRPRNHVPLSDKHFIARFIEKNKMKKAFMYEIESQSKIGFFTEEQFSYISEKLFEFRMSKNRWNKIAINAYKNLCNWVSLNSLTSEAVENLKIVQNKFGLSDQSVFKLNKEIHMKIFLKEINEGHLPTVDNPGIILEANEIIHWHESGNLIEERVIGRKYVGGSRGTSFRIAKGVSYKIGGSRGYSVSERGDVPVSSGNLIITNMRIVFNGDKKSFNFKFGKILSINFDESYNRMYLSEQNGKTRIIRFVNSENMIVIQSLINKII